MPAPLKTLIGSIKRKPTRAPDGKTDAQAAAPNAQVQKTSVIHDLAHLGLKNTKTLADALPTLASGAPLDDKELLLEHGVSMLQSMPPNSGLSSSISNGFIKMLWDDLPHPAATLAGPQSKYRSHDGSGNNPWAPEMGKAGTPYSRSVPPLKPKGPNLPNPELVFDQLLKRDGPFREHPSGLNRLFFSFATVVIHECFQTNRKNPWINDTSSYVDLSTLYGNTGDEQKRVRTYHNGLIFPDSIASERIMMMPPGVVAVLLLFSRNHNHIAANLLSINEDGKYREWSTLSPDEQRWQDEDVFQVARHVNVATFAQVVLKDYVAAILNTPRANSQWSLDLGGEIRNHGKRVERGTGNVVSVEFAVLYHWHAALSAADDKWMEDMIRDSFPDLGSIDDVTPEMFHQVAVKHGQKLLTTPAREWTFGGLERGSDGRFNDEKLADLIKDCIEEPAHAFGAHGTPASLKVVDILGQLQARNVFNVCTLNEFRRYLNLKPYETFQDWNEDKETARAAELLYGHIDNLELYPGLMAECTKPAMPGSGVCPGQTTGRGILNDAVALVRGDRFLTYDLNSTTLTNWGVTQLSNTHAGAYGGMLPNLFLNLLPGGFTGTSAYALLPFYTPTAARKILKNNKVLQDYDLERPRSDAQITGVYTQEACKQIFEDRENFRVMYMDAVRVCTDGHDFFLGWDDAARHDPRKEMLLKAFCEPNFEQNVVEFFTKNVRQLIAKNSLKYKNSKRRSIDIVRDVTNVTPILWLAERFAIPLKTAEHPHGILTIYETFSIYLVLFIYQSFNILPHAEWAMRDAARKLAPALRGVFTAHLKTQRGVAEHVVDWLAKGSAFEVKPAADRLYHALNDSKLPVADLAGDCIGMGAPVAGNITQQASLLIDLFLSEGYEEYRARIEELSKLDDDASFKELEGFVYEGMRHAGVVPGLPRRVAKDTVIQDGERSVRVKAGNLVLIATSRANMDPIAFPNPEKLDPHRPRRSYITLGHGLHFCFGARLVGASLAATLKEVFKLKNLRRSPGRAGHFSTVEHQVAGVQMRLYLDANAKESPIPTTLTLEYDAE